jgi:hypothetical protein
VWFLHSAAGEKPQRALAVEVGNCDCHGNQPKCQQKRKLISGGCKLSDSQIQPRKTTLAILRKLSLQES